MSIAHDHLYELSMALEGDVVGISTCLGRVVAAFREGSAIIQKLKTKCAEQRAPAPPRLLEESIDQAPDEIEKEKLQAIARYGQTFEHGDHLAIIALRQVTIDLQNDLLCNLRDALTKDAEPDYGPLVDTADHARDRTITILRELEHRMPHGDPGYLEKRASVSDGDNPIPSSREVFDTPEETAMTPGNDKGQARPGRKRRNTLLGLISRHQRSRSNDVRDMTDGARGPASGPNSPASSPARKTIDAADHLRVHTPSSDLAHEDEEQARSEHCTVKSSRDSARKASITTIATASSDGKRSSRGSSITAISTPTPDNDYLGFCRGAWRLQNGDRKGVQKTKEFNDGWSQTVVYFLMCTQSKCAFSGHFPLDRIWDKVWTVELRGLKFRWEFLAKSHVTQTRARDNIFWYQCLFCSFNGEKSPRLQGTDRYLDHLQQHRNEQHNDVLLYKTRCIMDRVADDQEDFDINLWPESAIPSTPVREPSSATSGEGASLAVQAPGTDVGDQSWIDGLPDFQYKCEFDRAEYG